MHAVPFVFAATLYAFKDFISFSGICFRLNNTNSVLSLFLILTAVYGSDNIFVGSLYLVQRF